ncbi:hypothetical protein [Streptomyces cavernae]|uniref:hypothetical protein n=1 Tax=Streptomyces cavernae TaxID=2259034 RepID=UPI000FEBDD87|nr:hypothetical protein [Streptomyces cavernae]
MRDTAWDGPWQNEFPGTVDDSGVPEPVTHPHAQPGELEYWVKAVAGCALTVERLMLPPSAEASVPEGLDEAGPFRGSGCWWGPWGPD